MRPSPVTPNPTATILGMLHGAEDHLSGQDICRSLGVSRTAVWKHIGTLRNLGYQITGSPHRGYRLDSAPNTPLAFEVIPRLKTTRFGHELLFLPETDSTNRHLAGLADRGEAEGTVVVADKQTGGRGRMDRAWFSPPDTNLYFSILLRPDIPPQRVPSLSLAIGLGVVRALRRLFPGLDIAIKWPNDLFCGGRKVAGILCEMQSEVDRVHYIIVGIGLNVNQSEADLPVGLRPIATSLRDVTGRELSRPALLAEILLQLEMVYDRWRLAGLEPLLAELMKYSLLQGREVTVACQGSTVRGTVRGLSPTGALILQTSGGHRREILSGDVHVEAIQ